MTVLQKPGGPPIMFRAIQYPIPPDVARCVMALGNDCLKAVREASSSCGDGANIRAAEKRHTEAQKILFAFLDLLREQSGVDFERPSYTRGAWLL